MLTRVALVLLILMFGVFGAWLLVEPERLEEWIGVAATTPVGRTELRAFYGGLELGVAALCAAALVRPAWAAGALRACAFMLGGVAMARVYGFAVDGSASATTGAFLASEVVGAAGAAWLAGRSSPTVSAS